MKTVFRLFASLVFLEGFTCIASPDIKGYKVPEPKLQDLSSNRNLQSPSAKLKIKLTSSLYESQNLVVSLQDPCVLQDTVCTPDPAYTQNQIPSTIRIPPSSSSPSLVYEYTGYFTSPISIDIYTTGYFTKKHYSNQGLTGTFLNQTSLSTLYYHELDAPGQRSSFEATGSILGPESELISCSMFTNDAGTVWINGVQVYHSNVVGTGLFDYRFEKNRWYNVRFVINNTFAETRVGMDLKWNIDGSYKTVDTNYMYPFTRESNIPYMLSNLKYNTYCDDVNGFRCIICDGLCIVCADNSGEKVCTSCKSNATLVDGQCICNPTGSDPNNCQECTGLCNECEEEAGSIQCITCKPNAQVLSGQCICNPTFYLSASDPNSCKECTWLCDECKEEAGNIKCITCKDNSTLNTDSEICSCNDEYYLSSNNPRECLKCNPLCSKCEEISGSQVCLTCKESARLESNDCVCIEGYYQPYYDSNPLKCYECPLSCGTCKEDSDGKYCTSCKENMILVEGACQCNEGYYLYDEISHECKDCEGICRTCNRLECTSCVENGEIIDGKCYCKEGYYNSSGDPFVCTPCWNEFCKDCQEIEGIYECNSCFDPYVLSFNKLCVCDEEYYNLIDNECLPIDFSLELRPSLNKLEIHFNQSLKRDLQFEDINHIILDIDMPYKLSSTFYTIDKQLAYGISYKSRYSIETEITVSLNIVNSVQNLKNRPLRESYYTDTVPILFLYDQSSDSPHNDTSEVPQESDSDSLNCDRCGFSSFNYKYSEYELNLYMGNFKYIADFLI